MITNEIFARGTVISEPVGREPGYWAGSPGAFYDESEHAWYLTYRIRRPRGVPPDRGGEVRIARSTDLVTWDDVLTIAKDRYNSASIERSCLHRGRDGRWRYFTSYVDPVDGRWCTAVLKAPTVAQLDPVKREVIFTAAPLGLEGVKDPWILEANGIYHLFLSIAVPTPKTSDGSHKTLDIFNTGECKSATGLAVSRDLENWEWQGVVFAPGDTGWDKYCRRLNSAVPLGAGKGESSSGPASPAKYLGFYDGIAGHHENYEEKCALAVSTDLRRWQTLSPDGPVFTSPHASTSLRYVEAKFANEKWHLFYEFARPDGAHELRMVTCDAAAMAALAR
ncbi:MAG: hypothetical protein HY736_16880 [Verrucomicrobia bacterium]|nr:hypothetical protein [Verrucomicrobiota bacterium]